MNLDRLADALLGFVVIVGGVFLAMWLAVKVWAAVQLLLERFDLLLALSLATFAVLCTGIVLKLVAWWRRDHQQPGSCCTAGAYGGS